MGIRSSFGTKGSGIAYFRVLMDGDALPDWSSPESYISEDVIPGSNPPIVEREVVATGDCTVTWLVEFESREERQKMAAKVLSSDVLTVPAHVQSHIGTYEERPDGGVEHLPHTILRGLSNVRTLPDGIAEAEVTFTRLIDPLTGEALP